MDNEDDLPVVDDEDFPDDGEEDGSVQDHTDALHRAGEKLSRKRAKKGEVKYATSKLTDPFMVTMVKHLAKYIKPEDLPGGIGQFLLSMGKGGAPTTSATTTVTSKQMEELIKAYIQYEVHEIQGIKNLAPILYSTLSENIVEDKLFTLMWQAGDKVPSPPGAEKFNPIIFKMLARYIAGNHEEMFPLVSFVTKQVTDFAETYVGDPEWAIKELGFGKSQGVVPTEDTIQPGVPGDQGITTAAASITGNFYFNLHFMQKLLDYAFLKKLKPKSVKYECNGGDVPDGYAYIEFLLMHELLHYTEDDGHQQKILKRDEGGANHKIINWAADFRSNHNLAKSGYEPLPMGLYADLINLDRQIDFEEMYDLIMDELDALGQKPPPPTNPGTKEQRKLTVGDKVRNKQTGNVAIVVNIVTGKNAKGEDIQIEVELDENHPDL